MDTSKHGWLITCDFIAEPGAAEGTNLNAVGVMGPRGCTLTAEQIKTHPDRVRFQLLDDDGERYYEGFVVPDPENPESEFAPLWDFGTPNAGCTEQRYRKGNEPWRTL